MSISIREIFNNPEDFLDKEIVLSGWVKTSRASKNFGFIELTDGTVFKPIQVVYGKELENFDEVEKFPISSSLEISGKIVKSPGKNQSYELQASKIEAICSSDPSYPLQKKRHTMEYLRTIAHLRPRANTFNAVFRVRSLIAYAIHKFFQEKGFVYVHAPIITTSDASILEPAPTPPIDIPISALASTGESFIPSPTNSIDLYNAPSTPIIPIM